MNGKYIIKESTEVAVQYFLIHHAFCSGFSGVWLRLPFSKSSSSLMKVQVLFLQTVQSSGVPLMMAVGATTIPAAKKRWIYNTIIFVFLDKFRWYTHKDRKICWGHFSYLALLIHKRENLQNYPTMAGMPFLQHYVRVFCRQEHFQLRPWFCFDLRILSKFSWVLFLNWFSKLIQFLWW